jgi:hypothetical protein
VVYAVKYSPLSELLFCRCGMSSSTSWELRESTEKKRGVKNITPNVLISDLNIIYIISCYIDPLSV